VIDPQCIERHRGRVWALCYRMTGVAADADELVQETFMRVLEAPPEDASRELLPWLLRVATNKSIDLLRRRKAQSYVGSWLPSPIDDAQLEHDAAPDARYGQAESLSYAFTIALEALSATQRAAVILRDVLGYSVREAAEALAISEANLKTSHHRAREALEGYEQGSAKRQVSLERAQQAMMRFMALVGSGDFERVASLLAEDVRAVNDGGGEFLAAHNPIHTREHVLRFFRALGHDVQVLSVAARVCGGLPALHAQVVPKRPRAPAFSFNLFEVGEDERIRAIYTLVATRKIMHWPRAASLETST
jgi:RNA polymerase sigma factor (sigma-70 family)